MLRSGLLQANIFALKIAAIVGEPPGSHFFRNFVGHAYDNVAVPRPGMIAIVLAGTRRMIRMRMIPSDDFQTLVGCCFLGVQDVLAGDRKAISRRIITAIYQRVQRVNFAIQAAVRYFRVAPE